jgi:glycosyltransferase involved in cell wall biosynthesis
LAAPVNPAASVTPPAGRQAWRILYFADIRFPLERANGIQTMETCWALAERGHRVDLVVRPDTQTPARDPFAYYGLPIHDRLAIERAPVTGPAIPPAARRLGYLAFAAGRALGTDRADVVMTRDLTVASLLLRLPSRAPVVYESHGYAPDVAAALPALLATATPPGPAKLARLAKREAYVWRHADGYVTITRGIASQLAGLLGSRARVAVVHDGARQDRVPLAAGREFGAGGVIVGYAGHLYAWKGVDILLEAIAKVRGVRGLIVGGHDKEPDLARVRARADALGIQDRVTFTGQVAPRDVPVLLAGADILALPNPPSALATHATSPLKLFEYMAAGKPVVASNLPSLREVLTDAATALMVEPGSADAIADAIRRLAGDRALRERLAEAAAAAVAEYSWSRRAERLEALFHEVLSARAHGSSHR